MTGSVTETKSVTLSPSSLGSIATCTTQAWLSKRCGLTTREKSAALKVGGCAHQAMAHFLKTRGDVAGAMQLFEQGYKEWALANVLSDNVRAWGNADEVLRAWLDANRDVERLPYVYDENMVEQHVEVELCRAGEMQVCLQGFIDLPVKERATGAPMLLDHKFTGWLTSDSVSDWRLSAQFKAYAWMWGEARGENVRGVMINAVEWSRLPAVQWLKSGAEKKCRTHNVPYSECRLWHAKKQLVVESVTPEELVVWKRDAVRLAKGFVSIWETFDNAGVDPRHVVGKMPMEGTFSGACKWCEFKKFCSTGRHPNFLATMMVAREERGA